MSFVFLFSVLEDGSATSAFRKNILGRHDLPEWRTDAEVVGAEKNISLFLNTRAYGVGMKDKETIKSVLALDVRSGQRYRFEAPLVIDTTGHGWVGFYAGADYRMGTESRATPLSCADRGDSQPLARIAPTST